ncbi:ETX/MTX2 family pore-forming toxin [Pseudanabaena sp. PCC 6802]|uniref:ETX/MTX2 family pore-forming toxin n=1 Tax=Pseudanabaena sp. PCC 6802 TaxID=118173 RepID=UPI001CED4026|nr:ETX/MTX2 family pore-forming toxin [Pseudanabaena sp. PCC 6802]
MTTNTTEIDVQKQIESIILNDTDNIFLKVKEYVAQTSTIDVSKFKSIAWVDCYEVYVDLVDFKYSDVVTNYTPEIVGERIYTNDTGTSSLDDTFTYSKTLTESFTFGFSEGLKVGASAKFKAGLPIIGEGEVSLDAEVSFTANQSWTQTESRTWSQSTKVTVPPHSDIKVTAFISQADINSKFTGTARATDGHIQMGVYIDDPKNIQDLIIPIVAILTDEQRGFPLSGTFAGVEGVLSYTKVEPVTQT